MTNYEQQLIRELRRANSKAMGKLAKRIDRAIDRSRTISIAVADHQKRLVDLESNIAVLLLQLLRGPEAREEKQG